jgi:hypothetical protein
MREARQAQERHRDVRILHGADERHAQHHRRADVKARAAR